MKNEVNYSSIKTKGLKIALEYTQKRDPIFKDALHYIKSQYPIEKVLYPGSYAHISPSLIFPETVYVDNYKKTQIAFADPNLEEFINENKEYEEEPKIRYHLIDYNSNFGEKKKFFDLLISLSAGFISVSCSKYLKRGGLLLVDNEHNDAARAFISNEYKLIGVFDKKGLMNTENLEDFFQTKRGNPLTLDMIMQILTTSPSKLPYKFKKTAPLYLFKRI